ncbi:MAG: hypothetical protein LBQ23_00130 [Puniceicoccales bacterium]|jgi:hypothetical protein|nr:hypothetical protein [Puniceicoccales bacterium]
MSKFSKALNDMPLKGSAMPCHPHLLRIANYGCMEGLSDAEMRYKMRQRMLETGRTANRFREVEEAVAHARRTCNPPASHWHGKRYGQQYERPQESCPEQLRSVTISKETFLAIANLGKGITKQDLLEVSNPKPHGNRRDGILFLSTLFANDDILLLGEKFSKELHTRDQWISLLEHTEGSYPFFIINPLSGNMHANSSGKMSNRCDAAVRKFKYALVEFDGDDNDPIFSLDNQLAFFSKIDLPIVALTYSGNKSIHAIVSLGKFIGFLYDWQREVKNNLFGKILRPLGADFSNSNPSRMSRFQGHTRDNGNLQELLYINPTPRHGSIF